MHELLFQKWKKYLAIAVTLGIAIGLETLIGTIGLTFLAIISIQKTYPVSTFGYLCISISCDTLLHFPLGTTLLCISAYLACNEYLLGQKHALIVWILHCLLFMSMYFLIQLNTGKGPVTLWQGIVFAVAGVSFFAMTTKRGKHNFIT